MTAGSSGTRRGRELALFAAALVVTLLFVEAALRIAGYRYSPMKVLTSIGPADFRFEHTFESRDFTFDPDLIWRPVPGRGVFNAQGFRGREITGPKPAGTVRLLAVGDSNTLGHQGQHGANWPLLLETSGPGIEVINAGVYGYASFQGVRRLTECLRFDPDVVLISFGANDAHLVAVTDAQYAARLAERRGLLRVLTHSRVGQLLVEAYEKLEARGQAGTPTLRRVPMDDYRENLRKMVALAREHKAVPVLLTRPFEGRTHDPESWKSFGPDYNQITREVGAEMGVTVVDLYKNFKRRKDVFEDESHFTPEGHAEAARYVWERIGPLLSGSSNTDSELAASP